MEANMRLTLDIERANSRTAQLQRENDNLRRAVQIAQRALQLKMIEISNHGSRASSSR